MGWTDSAYETPLANSIQSSIQPSPSANTQPKSSYPAFSITPSTLKNFNKQKPNRHDPFDTHELTTAGCFVTKVCNPGLPEPENPVNPNFIQTQNPGLNGLQSLGFRVQFLFFIVQYNTIQYNTIT